MEYVFYGSQEYDASKFNQIKNSIVPSNKPDRSTGLWASPVDSSWGWKDWCDSEEFRGCDKENSFTFSLDNKAKIFTVDSLSDLEKLPSLVHPMSSFIFGLDFEKIAKEYDAIFLSSIGQEKTRMSHPASLYGWDCECILVLNKGFIISN